MALIIGIAISPQALRQHAATPTITINVDFSDNRNSGLIAALGI